MIRTGLKFTGVLLGLLFGAGALHWAYFYANGLEVNQMNFFLSYLVNAIMAAGIYAGMSYLALRKNKYLGFIFLWGSALKFAGYFLILQPLYQADGTVTRSEFFYFFIPYVISLIIEVIWVASLLQSMEEPPDTASR